ncbi:hypothetical protein ACFFX0_27405 [Citricoccus parietis]|uniref:Uncharacterized protein n=1 Tax=Citricoccus parietis TaxID=592307 RepID=A0ABV5G6Y0_9MICC
MRARTADRPRAGHPRSAGPDHRGHPGTSVRAGHPSRPSDRCTQPR